MNKIAVICTSYHKEEIKKMLSIVESTAKKLENLEIEDVYWIPGALEIPFALKAAIIPSGIRIINVWSLLMNIFSIAGSRSQAVAEVLAATITEKIAARKILPINLPV